MSNFKGRRFQCRVLLDRYPSCRWSTQVANAVQQSYAVERRNFGAIRNADRAGQVPIPARASSVKVAA
jgi:hypothetical protein